MEVDGGEMSFQQRWLGSSRLLPMTDQFFEDGDAELYSVVFARNEALRNQIVDVPAYEQVDLEPMYDFRCSACGYRLMSGHLLDLHLSESHDPFLVIQAAKRMKVFRCLVEGCIKEFSSVMDRRKHLTDWHAFPTNYAFDRMHLARKQGQRRPEAGFQKARGRGRGAEAAVEALAEVSTDATRHDPEGSTLGDVQPMKEDNPTSGDIDVDEGADRPKAGDGTSRKKKESRGPQAMEIDGLADSFSKLLPPQHNAHQPRGIGGRGRHRLVL